MRGVSKLISYYKRKTAKSQTTFLECNEYGNLIYETTSVPSNVLGEGPIVKKINTCAHSAVELIVGGEAAREREFPHMVLIGYKDGKPDGM